MLFKKYKIKNNVITVYMHLMQEPNGSVGANILKIKTGL